MITSKWFSESEFQSCTPSCSLQDMDQSFMDDLDWVREDAGIPLVITCGHRSSEWDRVRGRSGTGAHTMKPCPTVDIRCNTSINRYKIVRSLIRRGFTRIGIAKTFIHADKSKKHSQGVTWLY